MLRLLIYMALVNCGAWMCFWYWKVWPSAKAVMWYMPVLYAIPLSYCWLYLFKNISELTDGETWPARLIAFSVSTLTFAFMSWFFLGESPITLKTGLCLLFAAGILGVQLMVK